ncbi:MAG: signal recognition particle protein [Candidatus Gastranaerophilales bacterium]|nr:signal recognition particle protein [Candidatus Gastranaerophilales bacterium]
MFESLADRLQNIIQDTTRIKELTQDNMKEALREIRRALLEADVNLRVVKSFISNIKDKAEGEDIIKGVNPTQQLVKIVNDELVNILGKEEVPLNLDNKLSLIMMLGLQGSGKTTSSAKLAVKLKSEGKRPLLVACDVYRPAAIKQLKTLAEQIDVECFSIDGSNDVSNIVKSAKEYASENNYNVLILDTAGRLQIDIDMMAELLLIDRMFKPDEKLLVIDSMVGQEAVNVAENFDEQLGLTGIVLTKLDGDSRGGAALSVSYCTGKPIKLTGTGEKLNALETFYPERIATRILGMGDIVSFVERAKEVIDEEEARELEKKMERAEFSFNDFLKMKKQMNMFGSLDQIMGMIPGLNLAKDQKELISHEGEKQFKKIEVFIQSMTEEERNNPQLLNSSRKRRIAAGSGISIHDINIFIKQFEQMREMMKGMSGMKKNLSKFAKMGGNLGGKLGMKQMMQNMRRFK